MVKLHTMHGSKFSTHVHVCVYSVCILAVFVDCINLPGLIDHGGNCPLLLQYCLCQMGYWHHITDTITCKELCIRVQWQTSF